MPKVVEIPNVGNVEFPDSMTDADIQRAIETDILPKAKAGAPAAAAPAAVAESEERSIGGFVKNIASSAGQLVEDVGHMIANPIDTATAVGKTAVGGVQKLAVAAGATPPAERGLTDERANADAVVEHMKSRYGDFSAVKRTAYEDPIGFALDLSAVLSGGATAAAKTGLGTTSRVLLKAAEFTDPIRGAAQAVGATTNAVGRVAAPIIGQTTGVGSAAVREAAAGSEAFKTAMRGKISDTEIVVNVKNAVKEIAAKRSDEYAANLAKLPQNVRVGIGPVQQAMNAALKEIGVTLVRDAKSGQFVANFDRAKGITSAAERTRVQEAIDTLAGWGTKPNDLTPVGVDTLKRQLFDRLAHDGSTADRIVTKVAEKARETLEANVAGYKEMTRSYAQASDFLRQVSKELSTGAADGTIIRKLSTALNQRNGYREVLLDALDEATGANLRQTIAGADMRAVEPRGLTGKLAAGGTVITALSHPAAWIGLALSSPRFVGEALVAIANAKKAKAALPNVSPAAVVAPVRAAGASGDW